MWQATEGTLKQWGLDDVTEKQKFLFQTTGANMFGVSAAGVALLKGKSLGTALGKPNCIKSTVHLLRRRYIHYFSLLLMIICHLS